MYCDAIFSGLGFDLGRQVDQVVEGEALAVEGGGLGGERLRRRRALAGHVDCGTGRSSMGHTGLPVTRSKT